MKRVLIVADVYPPEVSSASALMRGLAVGLAGRGYAVTVVTSYPRHYLAANAKDKDFSEIEEEDGVRVIRTKVLPHHKVNFVFRGVAQLLLPFIFFRKAVKRMAAPPDVVIVYSPPLPQALVGLKFKKKFGSKVILNVQDIFPQNAIDLGILRSRPLITFFEWLERRIYDAVDVITFNSDGGRRFLIDQKGVPPEKVITLPNWIDLEGYKRLMERKMDFRGRWGLVGKFVFLFGGILGPAQGLDFLIEVASRVTDMPDIVFLLVGDGTEKGKIRNLIRTRGLKNVVLMPFVEQSEYPALVNEMDVGVVCLSSANKTSFIPGKFLGYLGAGKPVLALLNHGSDGFELVKRAQCGFAVEAGDINGAVEAVRSMRTDNGKTIKFGANAREFALNHLSLDSALDKLESQFS